MKYITDTDFLPRYTELEEDLNTILYYPIADSELIRRFTPKDDYRSQIIGVVMSPYEHVTRKAMTRIFIAEIQKAIDKLEQFSDDSSVRVYIPFLLQECSPANLILQYRIFSALLEEHMADNWKTLDLMLEEEGFNYKNTYEWHPRNLGDFFVEASEYLEEMYKDSKFLKEKDITIPEILYREMMDRNIQITNNVEAWSSYFDQSPDFESKQAAASGYYRELFFQEEFIEHFDKSYSGRGRRVTKTKARDLTLRDKTALVICALRIYQSVMRDKDIAKPEDVSLMKDLVVATMRLFYEGDTTKDGTFYSYVRSGFKDIPKVISNIEGVISDVVGGIDTLNNNQIIKSLDLLGNGIPELLKPFMKLEDQKVYFE